MNSKKRMTRDERKAYIKAVLDQRAAFGMRWGTMYDIAKWANMSPSTHLLNYLYEMVEAGDVFIFRDAYRPGIVRSWFSTKEQIDQKELNLKDKLKDVALWT